MRAFWHISTYLGIALIANALVVVAISTVLGDMIYLKDGRDLFNSLVRADPIYNFIVNISIFPVAATLLLIFLMPLRHLYLEKATADERALGTRRLLNAPIIVSSVAIIGWLIGNGLMYGIYFYEGVQPSAIYIFTNALNMIVIGLMPFIFCFYCLDYLNRRFYIPRLFPDGRIEDFSGGWQLGIRFRLQVYTLAVSVGPILILAQAAWNLLISGSDVVNTTPNLVIAVAIVLILIALFLSHLLARYIRFPVGEMREAVHHVERLDFDVRLAITGSDEISQLASGINSMAAGLREKEAIKETFGRAVDPRVRDHLLSKDFDPGGESRDVTVLFSDIRGFTSFTEGREPREVVAWLNDFFEHMSTAIEAHGGIVNKYIGDAIMAVFNAPLPVEDHVVCAVKAARDMIARLPVLNARAESTGQQPVDIGIGIATGLAMAGNIGSQNRKEYTVIGDVVNTASRVEGLCKQLNTVLLFTEEVARALPEDLATKQVARGKVKGKAEAVTVFTLKD